GPRTPGGVRGPRFVGQSLRGGLQAPVLDVVGGAGRVRVVADVDELVGDGEEYRLLEQRQHGGVGGHQRVGLVQQVVDLVVVQSGLDLRQDVVDLRVAVVVVVAATGASPLVERARQERRTD